MPAFSVKPFRNLLLAVAAPIFFGPGCPLVDTSTTSATTYINRGNSSYSQGQYAAAIASYDKALEISPNAAAYNGRGISYRAKGDYEQSIKDLSKALELDPKSARSEEHTSELQ